MKKKYLNRLLLLVFSLSIGLSGCMYTTNRPQPLSDPLESMQPASSISPNITGMGEKIPAPLAINIPYYSPPSTTTTLFSVSTVSPTLPITPPVIQEKEEDVIYEETLFIPSALQNTPDYEIEIVSSDEIQKEKKAEPIKAATPSFKKIKVKKGDTLYSIAQSKNIKVYDLAAYNKLKAPFTLKPGQMIKVPSSTEITKTQSEQQAPQEIITNLDSSKSFIEKPKIDLVTIKKGDTVYSIAKKNNVPLKDLIIRNKLTAPYILKIGQQIIIPGTAFHIVQKEDTIYSISRKYNVNLNSLAKLNNLKSPFIISIGQKITLPASNIDSIEISKKKEQQKKIVSIKKAKKKQTTPVAITPKPSTKPAISKPTTKVPKKKIENIIIKPSPLTSAKFMWPVNGKTISNFGIKNNGKRNDGINIAATIGTKVKASENGIIAYAGNELKGLGNLIIIKHDKNYMTIYAHNNSLLVNKGQRVKRGDNIATVGKTGRVTTPQLHFEVRQKTKSINPITVLERK